jgi:hypothetical protein
MRLFRRVVFASLCALLAFASANITAEQDAAPPQKFVTYTGKIMAVDGPLAGTPTDISTKVYFYSSPEELQKYEEILAQKGGHDMFVDALHKHFAVGEFRLGTDLCLCHQAGCVAAHQEGSQSFSGGQHKCHSCF